MFLLLFPPTSSPTPSPGTFCGIMGRMVSPVTCSHSMDPLHLLSTLGSNSVWTQPYRRENMQM